MNFVLSLMRTKEHEKMCTFFLIATSIMLQTPVQHSDAEKLFKTLYSELEDVYFEYEGTWQFLNEIETPASAAGTLQIGERFSGSFLYRNDGSVKFEVVRHQNDPRRDDHKFVVTDKKSTFHGKTLTFSEQGGAMGATTDSENFVDYQCMGSPVDIFLLSYLIEFSKYEKKTILDEGITERDGRKVHCFDFVWGLGCPDINSKKIWHDRYYLDIERDNHAIRFENTVNGQLQHRTVDIVLQQFPTGRGHRWLPISGKVESGFRPNSSRNPTNVTTFSVMKSSVKINTYPSDDDFKLRLPNGTLITDKLNGKKIRSGDPAVEDPTTIKDAEAELKRQIQIGETQGTEILADSASIQGGWFSYSMVAGGISALILLFIGISRLRRR